MQEISLLNSVIGPVMRGPSSSHCAAPYMMGRLARDLSCGVQSFPSGKLISAIIRFDPRGSFSPVYQAQSTDENFAAGLSGIALTDPEFRSVLGKLEAGGDFSFTVEICELDNNNHPNRVDLELCVERTDGVRITDVLCGASVGGGMFYLDRFNGETVLLSGKAASIFIWGLSDADQHRNIINLLDPDGDNLIDQTYNRSYQRLDISFQTLPDARLLRKALSEFEISDMRCCHAAQHPVRCNDDLFSTSQIIVSRANDGPDEGNLADLAVRLEAQRLGLDRQTTRNLFVERAKLMLQTVEDGFNANAENDVMRFLKPKARKVRDANLASGLGGPVLQDAIAGALSAMERDSNRGIVCAAPTAGSAGVVPGTLYALTRHGISLDHATDALQVMALIGAVYAARGTFAAECGGCAVETGASAAMAAAGVTFAYGGTPEQCFDAASMCLMNTLGLVCDPVGGDVEIPCHARNVAGVSHAFSSAMAILAGFDAVLGFDELVDQTVKIGTMMHADLRCTARGGCAATKTAQKLVVQAS